MKPLSRLFALSFILLFGLIETDTMAQWSRTRGPYGWELSYFAVGSSTILAGSPAQGIFRSSDNGFNWTEANNGLWATNITSLYAFQQSFFAGVWDGSNNLLYLSTDKANTWSQVNTVNPANSISCFIAKSTKLFMGTYGDGVYYTTDVGQHWQRANNGGLQHPIMALSVINSYLYAGTWGGGIYVSANEGDTWAMLTSPSYYVTSLAVRNDTLYMASGNRVYASTNLGAAWTDITSGLPFSYRGELLVNGANLYLGTDQGIYLSTDHGYSWHTIGLSSMFVEAVAASAPNLIVGTRDHGIFTSSDNGEKWIQTGAMDNVLVQSMAVIDSNLFVGNNGQEGIFISRDNGRSFTEHTNLNHSYVLCLKTKGMDIFAGTEKALTDGGGIFKSSDYGRNWSRLGLKGIIILAVAYYDSYLFAGSDQGVFRTTNEGATWTQVNTNLGPVRINALTAMDTTLYAATNSGVYRSVNHGANWSQFGLKDTSVTSLLEFGTNLYAGTPFGFFANASNRSNWSRLSFTDTLVLSLDAKNEMIFAGTSYGLFMSENGGMNWTSISEGLNQSILSCFAVNDKYVFAGTWGESVWRRPLSDITTSVAINDKALPSQFNLFQNYPNPFNPSTVITYQLPENDFVSLKIFDSLGREVKILVNEQQNSGTYSITFHAADLPNGIYFYKLLTASNIETKKFILLK